MAKLNSIGVKARDIDRIFADAIRRIAEREDEFSCVAISPLSNYSHNINQLKVRQFYTDVLALGPRAKARLDLLGRVIDHVGCDNNDESQGFRILMLSLVKAAWRDLV
ncbi:hypothetical protein LCGC14_2381420 [marine sediment metagenome]|uniref:Uncharacterized protein n=1 Tax=marine sediment metagenome TaxID=412755 RepID=A0A0F9CN16_9ZZZZ